MKLSQFLILSLVLISISSCVFSSNHSRKYKSLELPFGVSGPESIAFDCDGEGPYTGVSDGHILKWEHSKQAWKEFATTSLNRIPKSCNGSSTPEMEQICGRPLGLKFNEETCDLYIADAYFGLMVVSRHGGMAKQLAVAAGGVPFRFTNALDIDPETGVVYFTDTSTIYQRWNYAAAMLSGDKSGRLLKYDPSTKQVTTLLSGLSFANGVALSSDSTFVLVTETTAAKVTRFWLQPQNSQNYDTFAELDGCPDNIQKNVNGDFWVAQNSCGKSLRLKVGAVRLDKEGKVREELEANVGPVSEVVERGDRIWLGSVIQSHVGILS